jgi:hypothetical protein
MPKDASKANSTDIRQAISEHVERRTMSRVRHSILKLCNVAMVVGVLNFALFIAGTIYFGGDAWSGKAEGGKYFLWGPYNGVKTYHEVSRAVFSYSRWHVYSVMVTWPLVLLAAFASSRVKTRSDD